MPANMEQPRRDDKSATPSEHGSIGKRQGCCPAWLLAVSYVQKRPFHGSIGKNSADVVCGTKIGGSGHPAKPRPPVRLALVEKHAFRYYAAITLEAFDNL